MTDAEDPLSPSAARRWLGPAAEACLARGLSKTAAWLAELELSVREAPCEGPRASLEPATADDELERPLYVAAKALFDCREYLRAASLAEGARSKRVRFLWLYSRYLFAETRRLDDTVDAGRHRDLEPLRELRLAAEREFAARPPDAYELYVYGACLERLELTAAAARALSRAVSLAPWLWCAWLELAKLTVDVELPAIAHPIKRFYEARAAAERKRADEALDAYESLEALGYGRFSYLRAQIAVARHDLRDADGAQREFERLRKDDPYRLDELDVYSHLLYVKEARTELAALAHRVADIDKYRVETCCTIGNYYSLRGEHQKAVLYFQRALRQNPGYLSAWILMGHEFVELQNTNAAIQSYRRALEVNKNDYRAWNGLGQAYEILGLNGYCLYYYARAAQQCPNDSRMLVALGEAFEKLDKIPNALKCYHRAHGVGDIEGMAILKLAKLYDKLSMEDSAAAAYSAACLKGDAEAEKGLQEAYRYLAHYHLNNNNLDHAAHYANKCLSHEETKEEGKSLLKIISERRAGMNNKETTDNSSKKMCIGEETTTPKPSTIVLNFTPFSSPNQSGSSSRYRL